MLLFPICLFAQTDKTAEQDITGLWKGSLYNDSAKKLLPYEIAISEEKGKLTGYSYTLFEDSGKKEIGVKRIKIKRKDGEIIIEDVEMISNNFSVAPPKKVKVQSILALYVSDTSMEMRGRWSTNRTWEYSQLTGSLQVKRSIDFKQMALFEQLQELKLEKDLSFVKAAVKAQTEIARVEKPSIKNKTIAEAPAVPADVDKPNELKTPEPEKNNEIAIEKQPAKTAQKPIEITIAKTVVEIPKETESKKIVEPVAKIDPSKADIKPTGQPIATTTSIEKTPSINSPSPVKKTTELIAKDSISKNAKDNNQSIAKTTAVEKPAAIKTPLPGKKTTELLAKDAVTNKTKPAEDLAIKPLTKLVAPIIPPIEKKDIVAAPTIKKENAQPVIEQPKTIAPPPVTKNTAPVATVKAPEQKDNKPVTAIAKKPVVNEKPAASITQPVIKVAEPIKPVTTTAIVAAPEQKTFVPVIATVPLVKAAADVAERKMKNQQSVFFESDSLVLTLYDNGEVDGDTVSVLMNGQIIFAKQGLTEKPNSKTIYIEKSVTDSISMVMYAESLGSIPPNTGLLIIMDGEKRYEVRFSADLQTNAAILLRRKPKEQ